MEMEFLGSEDQEQEEMLKMRKRSILDTEGTAALEFEEEMSLTLTPDGGV
jgi:hypothetical protein